MAWWIKQLVHPSWHIACVSVGFVFGVWLASVILAPEFLGLLGALCIASALLFRFRFLLLIGCVGGALIGLSYGAATLGDRSVYGLLVGKEITFSGTVREDPSQTASGDTSLQLKDINISGHSFSGSVFVTTRATDALRGDIVTISGKFSDGFGSFNASVRRATVIKVIRPEPGDIGRRVRDWFASNVREQIKDPQASLGVGFLTGQKSALPTDLAEALKIAGLTHIVVASGYNLTILVRLSRRLFVKVSKYLSAVSSSFMIIAFVSVTGMSPSMTRAGLVSGLSLLTWYYGHNFHALVLLPFAAAITVLIEPSYAWGDLGWQLSFAAFAGVMVFAPLLQRYFFGEQEPGVLRQILGETIAAHAVTIPVIAMSFGITSNVAILANLLVVPLVPLAMLLTFAVGILQIFHIPFIFVIAMPTEWLLTYMTSSATFLSELPWAQSEIQLEWWGWAIYIAIIIVACIWMASAVRGGPIEDASLRPPVPGLRRSRQ